MDLSQLLWLSAHSEWKEPCCHEASGCCWVAWNDGDVPLCPSQADLTVDTSVRGLLSVLPILSEKHSGALLNWEGKAIPW